MRRSYDIDVMLDLGDIGMTPATLSGVVETSGQYTETKITKVVAHISLAIGIDVTSLLNSAAKADLDEQLEEWFISDIREGA